MTSTSTSTSTSFSQLNEYVQVVGTGEWRSDSSGNLTFSVEKDKGISPILYFKYTKSKFKMIERNRIDRRLKQIEKAFNVAVENGQDALAEKFLKNIAKEARESELFAKGVRYYIDRYEVNKYKNHIRGGHISDTKFQDYTRVIPKDVIKKKKKFEGLFDEFIIYHYWNPDAEDMKTMDRDEKEKMKDPILFGVIKETNRLYFIADWEDEYCDLTFDEMIDLLGMNEEDQRLTKEIEI